MVNVDAVAFVEEMYKRTDKHIRDLLAAQDIPSTGVEVDTINVIIGDGVNLITPGIAAAIRVDFRCTITGCFTQEFDGTTGSIRYDVQRSPGGSAPVWARISPVTRPGFTDDRYNADPDVFGWLTPLDRGDYLRFVVASAADVMRVHVALRIQRLEP